MKRVILIICSLMFLAGCGNAADMTLTEPSPRPSATPIIIPVPVQSTAPQPEETVPTEPDTAEPKSPVVWLANCEEYISLREREGGEVVLAKIPAGESLELLDWSGKYAHVTWAGMEGYVLSSYIMPAEDGYFSARLSVVRPTDTYSYEQMCADIERLCDEYPESIVSESIGTSELGCDIPVLRIGPETADTHILFQAAIHGREHMTAWLLTALAEYWLKFDLCPENVCLHIIPMSNPDGVTVSQSGTLDAVQSGIYQNDLTLGFMDDEADDYAALWKANALGTDINRNFPCGWELIDDHLQPSSERYRGSEPFSSAEAKALRDYTLSYDFDVTISYHAMGSVIYWEYGDVQPVNNLSHSLAEQVKSVTGYDIECSDSLDGAGYKDWAMDELGIPSLTIEVGCEDAPLHYRELYAVFERNLGVLRSILSWLEA